MKISGIYKIESKIKPTRIYIGSATNTSNRWAIHLHQLRNNKHHSIKLQRHFNKYGEGDLRFSILMPCDIKDLIIEEQRHITLLNPYFNISQIAASPMSGRKHSLKTLEKFKNRVAWNKGRKGIYSEETLNKLRQIPKTEKQRTAVSESNKIRETLESTKLKISNFQKGRQIWLGKKHTEESRTKMSDGRIGDKNNFFGKHHTEETKIKIRNSQMQKRLSQIVNP